MEATMTAKMKRNQSQNTNYNIEQRRLRTANWVSNFSLVESSFWNVNSKNAATLDCCWGHHRHRQHSSNSFRMYYVFVLWGSATCISNKLRVENTSCSREDTKKVVHCYWAEFCWIVCENFKCRGCVILRTECQISMTYVGDAGNKG